MFMVTTEDDDGMFWDDPICSDSEAELMEEIARRQPPEGYSRVLYRCEEIRTLS